MPLFEGIPPFAGEGITSGQALQAAYWDLKNQIDAILVSSGTLSATLTLGNDATGQDAINFNDISANRYTSVAGGLSVLDSVTGTSLAFAAVTGAVTLTSSALGTDSKITLVATNNLELGGIGGTIRTKNGTAGAVALGNTVSNGLMFGANTVSISTNGVEKWMVNSSGSLNPILDNTYDIGNGAVNPRDVNVSRDVIVGGIVKTDAINNATATDLVITGTSNSNKIIIGDSGAIMLETKNNGNIDLTVHGTGIITMNAAPTYTGTIAAAAGLSVVNGLIMQ